MFANIIEQQHKLVMENEILKSQLMQYDQMNDQLFKIVDQQQEQYPKI